MAESAKPVLRIILSTSACTDVGEFIARFRDKILVLSNFELETKLQNLGRGNRHWIYKRGTKELVGVAEYESSARAPDCGQEGLIELYDPAYKELFLKAANISEKEQKYVEAIFGGSIRVRIEPGG